MIETLEITMIMKCGECITHDNYSFKRSVRDNNSLQLIETINNAGFGHFLAEQRDKDTIVVTCKRCGAKDYLSVK